VHRYFEGPAFLGYAATIDYTSATNGSVAGALGAVDVSSRAWVTDPVPTASNIGQLRVIAADRPQGSEILRLNVSGAAYVPLQLTSPDLADQISSGRSTQVLRTLNLREGIRPFVATGGSGRYEFVGAGQQLLPTAAQAQYRQVPGTTDQYQIIGFANPIPIGQDFTLFVSVIDRFFGTVVSVSLRIAVVDALSGDITSDISTTTDAPADLAQLTNNIFDVTERGTFGGTVNARGVTQQAAESRRCSLVGLDDISSIQQRNVPCPTLSASFSTDMALCNDTCSPADLAIGRLAPWCFVANQSTALANNTAVPFRYCGVNDTCVQNVTNCSLTDALALDGAFACSPEAWAFGLPNGLVLNGTTCQIAGTFGGNWPDDIFNGTDPIPPREIRALVNITVNGGAEAALVRLIFRVFAPVVVQVVRNSQNSELSNADAVNLSIAEEVDVSSDYQAQIIISGGIEPYNIPAALAQLPPGLAIERVFQIRGRPTAETIDSNASSVATQIFEFAVENNYQNSLRKVVALPFKIGNADCLTSANGPNAQPCKNGGTCTDESRFDRVFACDCSGTNGFNGSNCETDPPIPPVQTQAAPASDDGGGNSVVIGAISFIFVLILVAGIVYMLYQRHLINKPFDFEANMAKMIDEGMLAALDGERRMPTELKRSRIVMLEKLGSGAFGDVNKGLYNPDIPGVPEFAVAIKLLKEAPTREERDELMKEATVSAQFNHENGEITFGRVVKARFHFCLL
jgi:hypothetical protein